jgi:hypothetical protein
MIRGRKKAVAGPTGSRRIRVWCATAALVLATLVLGTGCDEEEAMRTFRDAASTSLQTGMKSMMDGVIDGMFAVFELGTDQTGGESSGASSESDSSSTGA